MSSSQFAYTPSNGDWVQTDLEPIDFSPVLRRLFIALAFDKGELHTAEEFKSLFSISTPTWSRDLRALRDMGAEIHVDIIRGVHWYCIVNWDDLMPWFRNLYRCQLLYSQTLRAGPAGVQMELAL